MKRAESSGWYSLQDHKSVEWEKTSKIVLFVFTEEMELRELSDLVNSTQAEPTITSYDTINNHGRKQYLYR